MSIAPTLPIFLRNCGGIRPSTFSRSTRVLLPRPPQLRRVARALRLGAKTAAFAAVNPLKKVPALIRADGTTVFESNVILNYLEDKYKDAGEPMTPPTAEQVDNATRSLAGIRKMLDGSLPPKPTKPTSTAQHRGRQDAQLSELKVAAQHVPQTLGNSDEITRGREIANTLTFLTISLHLCGSARHVLGFLRDQGHPSITPMSLVNAATQRQPSGSQAAGK